jgi:predicted metal-binding protein
VVNDKRACLHICITCRRGDRQSEPEAAEPVPGRLLHDAVAGLLDRGPNSSGLEVQPVICLANCERGCSVILSAPGKWAYMVGGLGPEHAADVIAYGEAYAASETGTVLRAGRPPSLRHAILGRFPPSIADAAWTAATSRKEAAE